MPSTLTPLPILDALAATVQTVRQAGIEQVDTLIVLGSGLGQFANELELTNRVELLYSQLPHFPTASVVGHAGKLVFGRLPNGHHVALQCGRFHFYEGYTAQQVVYPLRVMQQLGAKQFIVTNASGGIHTDFRPGDLMIITDQLNLTGQNPMLGPNEDQLGPRFFDMSTAYSPRLIHTVKQLAKAQGVELKEGVYAGLTGPAYETPAEVRMLRILGADAVGMSTVLEVLAASHLGLETFGLSCITNAAAGLNEAPLNHEEVIEVGAQASQRLQQILESLLLTVLDQETV